VTGLPIRGWGGAAVALVGLTVFGAAVVWFGMTKPPGTGEPAPAAVARAPDGTDAPALDGQNRASPATGPVEPAATGSRQPPPTTTQAALPGQGGPAKQAEAAAQVEPAKRTEPAKQAESPSMPEQVRMVAAAAEARKAQTPSFDVVRIEPNGESVIAGRGAPGATVDLLRNGRSHARAIADTSGLFAFVPPPLAPGSHEIGLTSIAPDGTRAQSRESVTVVISEDRARKPLVTLTSPDRPTVVLSAPDSPEPKKPATEMAARAENSAPVTGTPAASSPPAASARGGKPLAARPNVQIKSVETEEGGRLFVSGDAAAGATVRLYLNDSFIAPGGTGSDGKVSFAIGSGVRPGDYRVRLDDVDPVSGDVRSRAEVAFNVPAPLTLPLPPQAEPLAPDAPLEGRAVAGAETAPSAQAPLLSALPSARGAASTREPSTAGATAARAPAAEPGTVIVPEINTAIVSRGDNLWRISRRIYGVGTRYTVIYDANQPQIRNPDRIYPGQIFVLPAGQAPAAGTPVGQVFTGQAPVSQGATGQATGARPPLEVAR
jgi:nucleoid-associated protein YgaU